MIVVDMTKVALEVPLEVPLCVTDIWISGT